MQGQPLPPAHTPQDSLPCSHLLGSTTPRLLVHPSSLTQDPGDRLKWNSMRISQSTWLHFKKKNYLWVCSVGFSLVVTSRGHSLAAAHRLPVRCLLVLHSAGHAGSAALRPVGSSQTRD